MGIYEYLITIVLAYGLVKAIFIDKNYHSSWGWFMSLVIYHCYLNKIY